MNVFPYIVGYLGIGFISVVIVLVLLGPKQMRIALMYRDELGPWIIVFLFQFLWPVMFVGFAIYGIDKFLVWTALGMACGVRRLFVKEGGDHA